jgi:hypothetical protein
MRSAGNGSEIGRQEFEQFEVPQAFWKMFINNEFFLSIFALK